MNKNRISLALNDKTKDKFNKLFYQYKSIYPKNSQDNFVNDLLEKYDDAEFKKILYKSIGFNAPANNISNNIPAPTPANNISNNIPAPTPANNISNNIPVPTPANNISNNIPAPTPANNISNSIPTPTPANNINNNISIPAQQKL